MVRDSLAMFFLVSVTIEHFLLPTNEYQQIFTHITYPIAGGKSHVY